MEIVDAAFGRPVCHRNEVYLQWLFNTVEEQQRIRTLRISEYALWVVAHPVHRSLKLRHRFEDCAVVPAGPSSLEQQAVVKSYFFITKYYNYIVANN